MVQKWFKEEPPENRNVQEGDKWFDSDDFNKEYLRIDGKWVPVEEAESNGN